MCFLDELPCPTPMTSSDRLVSHANRNVDAHAGRWRSAACTTAADLKGKVVAIHAFQMLCPGCVAHGLPLATHMQQAFSPDDLVVLGSHSVFEHHEVMQPRAALAAFIHEYRLSFPIGIDKPDPHGGGIPLTMRALALRGTPSLVLLDKQAHIRAHQFGRNEDLRVGALIGQLIAEPAEVGCREEGCRAPMQRHGTSR